MTNAQLYPAYIIPSMLVLIGILMNRSDNQTLRTEIRGDMSTLRGEVVALRNQIHQDMVALHERVAVVESKQSQT